MTVEDFWDLYLNENILDIFDETCEFFSQELPEGITDEYDAIEVIIETAGHNESAKNFDNVIKFIDIIQKHQPELYKESFVYLNDFLVKYYCFHHNTSKVEEAFSLFIDNPLESYDKYLLAYRVLLFYQKSELLNRAIVENYPIVDESEDIIGGGYDLAITKMYMTLQEAYEDQDKGFDKVDFSAKLEKYGFEIDDDILSAFQDSLSQSQLNIYEINTLFAEDRVSSIVILRGYFLRYMYERGFEFYLSGHIWDKMVGLWEEKKKKAKTLGSYFRVTTASFDKYLAGFNNIFLSDQPTMIATLWGSVYIYDFLHKLEIVSTEIYQDFLKTSQKLKGDIIGIFTPDLWCSNFVHHWQKPDSVSEDEFREEHSIFTKSISLQHGDLSMISDIFSEELSKIGKMADYILEGGKSMAKQDDLSFLDNIFKQKADIYDDEGWYDSYEDRHFEPIRIEPKVGRNEPCPCGSGKKYKNCCGKEK